MRFSSGDASDNLAEVIVVAAHNEVIVTMRFLFVHILIPFLIAILASQVDLKKMMCKLRRSQSRRNQNSYILAIMSKDGKTVRQVSVGRFCLKLLYLFLYTVVVSALGGISYGLFSK